MAAASASTAGLRGTVTMHSGIERIAATDDQTGDDPDRFPAIMVRVVLTLPSGEQREVHFRGRWASCLGSLEPGDRITLEGVERPMDQNEAWQVKPSSPTSVVTVFREGFQAKLTSQMAANNAAPAWLQQPSSKPDKGVYKYPNFLCTIRDGTEANTFAVVWENAKPGPMIQRDRRASANFLVVDRSFDCLPCTEWAGAQDLPLYSLQLSLALNDGLLPAAEQLQESVPFLCVGDVVRAHRVRVSYKPPRYTNFRMQRYSSLVAWQSATAAAADADPSAAAEEPESRGREELTLRSITGGAHDTVTEADHDRAAALRVWIREKLSRETVSSWLVRAVELNRIDGHRDLVVKVLHVLRDRNVLIATDGSTLEPLRILASEPADAASWLFSKVRRGHWLKLRAVSGDPTLGVKANAATVTRMPPWCFDVAERRRDIQPGVAEAAERLAAMAAAAPAAPAESFDDQPDSPAGPWGAPARAGPPPASGFAAGAGGQAESAAGAYAAGPAYGRLRAAYAGQVEELADMRRAAEAGRRCHLLGGFVVESAQPSNQVESLLRRCCRACSATSAWAPPAGGEEHYADVREAKRRREALPCGHWMFRMEYRFSLVLRSAGAPAGDSSPASATVVVADPTGELLGVPPDAAAASPASRRQAQRRLDAILKPAGVEEEPGRHTLAVYRVDHMSSCEGTLVVCDTAVCDQAAAEGAAEGG